MVKSKLISDQGKDFILDSYDFVGGLTWSWSWIDKAIWKKVRFKRRQWHVSY